MPRPPRLPTQWSFVCLWMHMRNRLLDYIGYGLGFFLVTHKDPPPAHMSKSKVPVATPPPTWLDPEAPAAESPSKPEAPSATPLSLVKNTWNGFSNDDCMTLGAAMAYYSVFSLAPLLLTVISIAGLVFGRQAIQNQIAGQIQALIGSGAAEQVTSMLAKQAQNTSGGIIGTVVGIVTLIFGATGAFAALQDALNKAWHVQPDPSQGGLKTFLTKRVMSFGMILGVVFLMIASLVVTAILAAVGKWMGGHLPNALSTTVAQALAFVVSLAVITSLFALIFKVLPDGRVQWRDAWVGGLVTSVLFTIGKTGLGFYLGKAAPGSAYGAAGSLVVIVLWLYYASLIVLFGAEFTKIWAAAHGREIAPESGAVRVVTEQRRADSNPQPVR
jgi:membrane protein